MFHENRIPPIISIVGSSGAGKTTLLEKLIPELVRQGFKVGTIKHHEHGFEMDRPGKDSWRHKKSGAAATIISSPTRVGLVTDVDHDHEVEELAPLLSGMDIILTEGYKREKRAKIEVFREDLHKEPLCRDDKHLIALVSDSPADLDVPRFSTDDIRALTDFLLDHLNLIPFLSAQPRKAAS